MKRLAGAGAKLARLNAVDADATPTKYKSYRFN